MSDPAHRPPRTVNDEVGAGVGSRAGRVRLHGGFKPRAGTGLRLHDDQGVRGLLLASSVVKKWRIALKNAEWKSSTLCQDIKADGLEIFSSDVGFDGSSDSPDVKVVGFAGNVDGFFYDAQHMHADSGRGRGAVVFDIGLSEGRLWRKILQEVSHHAGYGDADEADAEECATRDEEKERNDDENDDGGNGGGNSTGSGSGTWIWVPTEAEECEDADQGDWTCVWVSSGNPDDGGGYYHCSGCCSTDICWDVPGGSWVWVET